MAKEKLVKEIMEKNRKLWKRVPLLRKGPLMECSELVLRGCRDAWNRTEVVEILPVSEAKKTMDKSCKYCREVLQRAEAKGDDRQVIQNANDHHLIGLT